MNRRSFVVGSLGLGLTARPATSGQITAESEIGRAAIRAGAVDRDAATLRSRLGLGPTAQARPGPEWDARIRADFASARTVYVDSWVLSETEAQICALAALSALVS